MLAHPSVYACIAGKLRDNGYHPMPVMPGKKEPGQWRNGQWYNMSAWSQWCDKQPPEFLHEKWEDWPDAGICIAHGEVVGLDVDTDRQDVSEAAIRAVGPSPVRRVGRKGWMGYYRPGGAAEGHAARLRWYDPKIFTVNADGKKSYPPQVELLLHGTQSVIPPTIHPDTGRPYRWVTDESLEDMAAADLPLLADDAVAQLDKEFGALGLTREAPRRVSDKSYDRPVASDHDLEKPFGRSINDRAMAALDSWWPALDMPKTRQRGPGAWEAVPFWRGSNSGRQTGDRNPNLKAVPTGIVDYGADRSYTPVDVVMAARNVDFRGAVELLEQFVEPEPGMSLAEALAIFEVNFPKDDTPPTTPAEEAPAALWSVLSRQSKGARSVVPLEPVSAAAYARWFPAEPPVFPVQSYEDDLTGLLRDMTIHLDEAANMRSEQGALGAALTLLGAILGRKVEVAETGLRTNLYVVGTAESGAGKSSAMNAMMALAVSAGVDDRLAGSDFTSGSAILNEMSGATPKLFSIDEFGDVIRRVLNPRAAAHERDIGRILKDMFSSAAGVYRGKSYANQDRVDIVQPHLCLYGVSTYEAFWEGIDGRSFEDGLLARFIAIPIGATQAQTPRVVRLAEVLAGIKGIVNHAPSGGNLASVGMCPQPAELAPGLMARWMKDRETYQRHALRAAANKAHGAPSIINRVCENGMKIALISAAGRNIDACQIGFDDYELGMAIAHWSAISMIAAIGRYYVENASHKSLKRVLEYVAAAGVKGRTRSDLYRSLESIFAQGKDGDNALTALKASDRVLEWAEPATGPGRRKTWYVAAEHAVEFLRSKGAE